MANPVCSVDSLIEAAACFRCGFDAHERKALKLYLNVLELAAIGGTDYTGELGADGSLNEESAAYNTMSSFERELAELAIAVQNAENAGASVPSTPDALKEAMLCLKCFDPYRLALMQLVVECELGKHAGYPQ